MGLLVMEEKSLNSKNKEIYKYLQLTPFEAHNAALIFSPEDNKNLYESSRELLHQAYEFGIVYGVFKDISEIENLLGVGLRIRGEIIIKILPLVDEDEKKQIENKLKEILLLV